MVSVIAESSGRRRRGSLKPDEIVSAAVALVADSGLGALTMPEVARVVSAPVTSVYWHFRTKEELLAAMAARVTRDAYAGLPQVRDSGPWDQSLMSLFSAFRQRLLAHPVFLELFRERSAAIFADPEIGDMITRRLETELGVLVRAGVTPADAYRTHNAISHHVQGYVTEELSRARERGRAALNEQTVARQRALDVIRFPIMRAIPDLAALTSSDADRQFRYGLTLMVVGAGVRLGLPLTIGPD